VVHLPGDGATAVTEPDLSEAVISIEERLLPADGPLRLAAELPTGGGPKSVAFLPGGRIVTPLLWGSGADTFRVSYDRFGQLHVEPLGRIEPPRQSAANSGFVEPLTIASRGELWVSQMNGDRLHRFDLSNLTYRDSIPASGQWPKVMAVVPPSRIRFTGPVVESFWNPNRSAALRNPAGEAGELLVTSNWLSRTVVFHDRATGELVHEVHLDGQPRGIAVTGRPHEVWVTEFSTGDVVVIDPYAGAILERLPYGPGAARHIVAHPRDRRLYYSDMYHGTVSIIDGDSREVRSSRRFGSNVNTIAIDPRGRYLFVSERGRNNPESYHLPGPAFGRIFVVDADTLETVQTVWGRHQPTGLAVSADGTLLAATDFLDNNLSIFTIAE
jgi:DNA-binding beta-propeller fold protein YncE